MTTAGSRASSRAAPPAAVEVVFADLIQCGALLDAEERATPRLSPTDLNRLTRLASDAQRQRDWQRSRVATRIALERFAGAQIRNANFTIEEGGRPRLAEAPPHFSVSHSGTGVLIAISMTAIIGADLEAPRTLDMTEDRRRRIATAAAALMGDGKPASETSDAETLKNWVRLEAVAKARGTGIQHFLTDAGVSGGRDFRPGFAAACATYAVRDLALPGGFRGAVASVSLPGPLQARLFPATGAELEAYLKPN